MVQYIPALISCQQPPDTTAIGRIELDYPSALLVDYMTLLEGNGRWVIIAKSFNSAPKSR